MLMDIHETQAQVNDYGDLIVEYSLNPPSSFTFTEAGVYVLVPVRAIFETFGANIHWYPGSQWQDPTVYAFLADNFDDAGR